MFNKNTDIISQLDPEIFLAIEKEKIRQEEHIELIASENYASYAVMLAQGSQLTNKYAEGYPGKRYYSGCEYVDIVEQIAIDRVKKLFGSEDANVQPHSGSQANQSIFFAMLKPWDTIMGMSLSSGGHLTHGAKVNISGKWFNAISYGLDKNEDIDYENIEKLAYQHKPKLIIASASAFSLKIDFHRFSKIAKSIGSYLMVDMAHYAGLIAADVYPNPLPYADFVTTTTHKSLRGPRGGMILMKSEYKKKINSAVFPGIQGGPLMHVIAAKAIALKEAMLPEFRIYQKNVIKNAKILSETLINRGFRIVSGRTESHVMLVDLRSKKLTGKMAELMLKEVNITVNKNMIPNDTESAFVTSGIRLGSPAITTRGFGSYETELIGNLIADILDNKNENKYLIKKIKKKISEITKKFPVYK